MSPEQINPELDSIGRRSDIYGLGAILFELLTGKPPYPVGTVAELKQDVTLGLVPSARSHYRDIHPDLDRIVQCCLAKSPADRYQTAADLAKQLRRFLGGESVDGTRAASVWDRTIKWARRHWAAVLLAGIVASTLSIVAITSRDTELQKVWRGQLGRLPAELQYPGFENSGPGEVRLDEQNNGLTITATNTRLAQFGDSAGRDFELELYFNQPVWKADAGIFLGYHESKWDGVRVGRVQAIYIARRLGGGKGEGIPYYELRRALGVLSASNGSMEFITGRCLAKLPLERGVPPNPSLKVVVRNNQVVEIHYNGKKLDEFCSIEIEKEIVTSEYQNSGRFGAFLRGGGVVWINNPHFKYLSDK